MPKQIPIGEKTESMNIGKQIDVSPAKFFCTACIGEDWQKDSAAQIEFVDAVKGLTFCGVFRNLREHVRAISNRHSITNVGTENDNCRVFD
jgi:hypothetical protein